MSCTHFVDPPEWQFDRNEVLFETANGCVALDMLKDGRVGGVEFLDKVFGKPSEDGRHGFE